jgi:hypothetical protein
MKKSEITTGRRTEKNQGNSMQSSSTQIMPNRNKNGTSEKMLQVMDSVQPEIPDDSS